jgi:hypothetical protein
MKRRPKLKFVLVVHRQGNDRTLKTHYAYPANALREGAKRLIRGGDWFQLFSIMPEKEVAAGGKEGRTVSITYDASIAKEVLDRDPLVFPTMKLVNRKEKQHGTNQRR